MTYFIWIGGRLIRSNVIARHTLRCRTLRGSRELVVGVGLLATTATFRQHDRTRGRSLSPRVIRCHSEPKYLGKAEEALTVDKEIVLTESRSRGQGRRSVCHNLENVVASHSPAKVKDAVPATGIMNFLTIGQYQTLARCDTPNKRDIMLFATARGSCLSSRQSLGIGKPKPPKRKKLNKE
jgi:hypothetical protein